MGGCTHKGDTGPDESGRSELEERCARLERELATRDAVMASVFSQVRAGFIVVEPEELRVVQASLEGLGMAPMEEGATVPLGRPEEQGVWDWRLLGKDGTPFQEQEHPLVLAVRHGSSTDNLEAIVERPGGETAWVLVNASPVLDGKGRIVGGLMALHDVGRMKNMEAERIQGLTFFAHDMKSPLFGARSFVERLLQGKAGPMNEAQQQELTMVRELLDRVLTLAMDFLDVARMDKNGFELSLQPLDLKPLLQRLGREFSVRAKREGLTLETVIDSRLHKLRGDQRRLERVFVNLLDNAIKYTPKGTVRLNARNGPEDWIIVEVVDEGPGLSRGDMDGLFKTFHRGAAGDGTEGSGLGLAAARSIVEAHGGAICAANRFPAGACFTVLLPSLGTSGRGTRSAPPECP